MKRKKLTNSEIDAIARKLVRAAAPAESEVERIVTEPRLFDEVLARIRAGQAVPERRPVFSWKPELASVFGLVVVSVSLLAFLPGFSGDPAAEFPLSPQTELSLPAALVPPVPVAAAAGSGTAHDPRPEYAVVSPKAVAKPVSRRVPAIQPKPERVMEPLFHTIGFAEKAEDAAIDGRVVRVEMPRAALFAMGIDLPLENGLQQVKAELLLGADGAPKAIRLVD